MKIDIKGPLTGLTIYEVWEAMIALTSTCVRGRQKCGKATGLGLLNYNEVYPEWLAASSIGRNIFLQLSDENPDAMTQLLLVNHQNYSLLTND